MICTGMMPWIKFQTKSKRIKKFGAYLYHAAYIHQISFWRAQNIVCDHFEWQSFCQNFFENSMLNFMLASWKVIDYSKRNELKIYNKYFWLNYPIFNWRVKKWHNSWKNCNKVNIFSWCLHVQKVSTRRTKIMHQNF